MSGFLVWGGCEGPIVKRALYACSFVDDRPHEDDVHGYRGEKGPSAIENVHSPQAQEAVARRLRRRGAGGTQKRDGRSRSVVRDCLVLVWPNIRNHLAYSHCHTSWP